MYKRRTRVKIYAVIGVIIIAITFFRGFVIDGLGLGDAIQDTATNIILYALLVAPIELTATLIFRGRERHEDLHERQIKEKEHLWQMGHNKKPSDD